MKRTGNLHMIPEVLAITAIEPLAVSTTPSTDEAGEIHALGNRITTIYTAVGQTPALMVARGNISLTD